MKTTNFKTAIKLLFLTVLVSMLFGSCKKNDDEVIIDGEAKFRIVNAVQGSTAQDFYQGDTKVSTNAVAYGEFSDYLTVQAGNSTVYFKSADNQNVNATGSVGVRNDMSFTVFYINNSNGSGQIVGYQDDNTVPVAGKAHVRFLNLGGVLTNAIDIDFSNGEDLLSGLGYGNITGYGILDPNVDLKFSLVGELTSTIIPGSSFQAGKIYTVWFDATSTAGAQYHIVAQN